MSNITPVSVPGNLPATPSTTRLVRLGKSEKTIALRLLYVDTLKELNDELRLFKDCLNSKGLPDSRGDDIYKCVQGQVYTAFGLTPKQRKAIKGDSKLPLLEFLTDEQVGAINLTLKRLVGIYRADMEAGYNRDITKPKINTAIKNAAEFYGYAFGR